MGGKYIKFQTFILNILILEKKKTHNKFQYNFLKKILMKKSGRNLKLSIQFLKNKLILLNA